MRRAVTALAAPGRTLSTQATRPTAQQSWSSRILEAKRAAVEQGAGANAGKDLLDKLCASEAASELLKAPDVRHAVFVANPKPSIDLCVQLLPHATRSDYWTCLRTALYRHKFVESFKIIDIYPESLQLSVVPFAIGLASCTPWLPTLVAPIVAGCWIGLAAAAFSDANLTHVRWKPNVKWKYRLLNGTQLRMANTLVEHYEELPRAPNRGFAARFGAVS
ncbi:hypothetical protein B9G98_01716 [Wickerhamiella sorbophila]|uniref:Uncharacterized protein n=1 Tax=Wickerhamiella sorbophila TaxID=45607 RepID=A0A2T0FGI0_9ASCO|nr:hypothetical protein B9G98_01716 [Wickerhamiella sorbophila]PRT54096.1 hypothetical protein B9G98_01716 [Wickerhamiella sorbophila]